VVKIQHFRGLNIKQVSQDRKELRIVSEYKGGWIFTTGNPDDYAAEVASGAWFGSLVWPGALGLLVGEPVGLAAGVAVGGIMVYEFEKHVWDKLSEVVKKECSAAQL
jgi:hypothetical protein